MWVREGRNFSARMGGGADPGHSHGDFRSKVWSMPGGPYCRPKHWKRNTAIAMVGVFLVCIPVAMVSAKLEVPVSLPPVLFYYFDRGAESFLGELMRFYFCDLPCLRRSPRICMSMTSQGYKYNVIFTGEN